VREWVRIAAKAYNDENLDEDETTWDEVIDSNGRLVARGKLGDTRAEFIILELAETYDPNAARTLRCRLGKMPRGIGERSLLPYSWAMTSRLRHETKSASVSAH
jgi:hypothetical protein